MCASQKVTKIRRNIFPVVRAISHSPCKVYTFLVSTVDLITQKKNGTKTVPQGYYLIVRKTVPLAVLFCIGATLLWGAVSVPHFKRHGQKGEQKKLTDSPFQIDAPPLEK